MFASSSPTQYVAYTTSIEMSISLFNKATLLSKINSQDKPEENFLILAHILDTISRVYHENWWNFKDYSLIIILPCFEFTNFFTFTSLHFWGKK